MSILFTTGLPGHGKGAVNMREFERKLIGTERVILTSMTEIEVPKLAAYLRDKYKDREINLDKRLRFIEKRDVGQFYRYRGRDTLPEPPRLRKDMSDREIDDLLELYFKPITEGQPLFGGVEYMITEAHRHFRSEAWSEMSRIATFYLTQHRHFDDNVIIETQLPKQVVVQLRDLGEETWEMTNRSKQQMGWFQKPKGIEIKKFYRVPKTDSAEPFAKEIFQIEPQGIHGCYRTRGAVGVGGATPETETKKKALPFWTIYAGAALLLCLIVGGLWLIPQVVMGAMGWFVNTTKTAGAKALSQATPVSKNDPPKNTLSTSPSPPNASAYPISALASHTGTPKPPTQRKPTGYFLTSRGVVVQFDDGTRESTDPRVVTKVTIGGTTYPLAEVPTGEPQKYIKIPKESLPKEKTQLETEREDTKPTSQ